MEYVKTDTSHLTPNRNLNLDPNLRISEPMTADLRSPDSPHSGQHGEGFYIGLALCCITFILGDDAFSRDLSHKPSKRAQAIAEIRTLIESSIFRERVKVVPSRSDRNAVILRGSTSTAQEWLQLDRMVHPRSDGITVLNLCNIGSTNVVPSP